MSRKAAADVRLQTNQCPHRGARHVHDVGAVQHAQRGRITSVASELFQVRFGQLLDVGKRLRLLVRLEIQAGDRPVELWPNASVDALQPRLGRTPVALAEADADLREVLQEEVGEVLVGQHHAGLDAALPRLLPDPVQRAEEPVALVLGGGVAGRGHHRGVGSTVGKDDLRHLPLLFWSCPPAFHAVRAVLPALPPSGPNALRPVGRTHSRRWAGC